MNLDINKEWLLKMAKEEGNGIFSVGGLIDKLETVPKRWKVGTCKNCKADVYAGDASELGRLFDIEVSKHSDYLWRCSGCKRHEDTGDMVQKNRGKFLKAPWGFS